MNALLAALGLGCLVMFGVCWTPGAWLIGGLVLLLWAAVRSDNQRKAAGR